MTPKIVAYLITEEGIVPEAYKDSKGIWTWSVGVATTGGNDVLKYKDKPQPIEFALRAAIDLINSKYLPIVLKTFGSHQLSENELAAALSFQWRNGTISHAQWVKDIMAGKPTSAKADFMQWTDHGREVARCTRERDLFFDAKWPADLRAPVWEVSKPSYQPVHAHLVDVMPVLQSIMGGS